jgi:catechol 2,3-dioxygenase-like lactoylglutathione lyase family enzyme
MSIELNHTIVPAQNKQVSADFLAEILGVPVGRQNGPFLPITLDNRVTLDHMDSDDIRPQHYAFLIGEEDFDAAFARILAAGLTFFADPGHEQPGQIHDRWGGRGVYFSDPDGHNMEILTKV